jgi:TonB family protein
VGFQKVVAVVFALWLFLAQRGIAQTTPCASLALSSPEQRSAPVSDPDSGTVIMRVQVSKSGLIHDFEISSDPSNLAVPAIEAVKRWKYKPADWVTGPLTDLTNRYTFLSVVLKKGAAPLITEVEQSVPSGVGCGTSRASSREQDIIAWIVNSISPQIPRVALPSRIRVSQGAMRPFLVKKVNPDYPAEATDKQIGGMVVLHIIIDRGGNVSNVEPESGDPLLIDASILAVKQWKYKPYLLNKTPVEVETMVTINFVVSGGSRSVVVSSLR